MAPDLEGWGGLKGAKKGQELYVSKMKGKWNSMEKARHNKRAIMEVGTQGRGIATGERLKRCG